mmetsp:Transcript_10609/g.12069  ORF Transcript_10609/g.12069 Transcript_10609/m.12069 type:complete len:80 (-) Transcript_10609:177-416(-)
MIVVGSNTQSDTELKKKPIVIDENSKIEEKTGEELKIFTLSGSKLTHVISLHSEKGHNSSIKDVAWAPQNGRTYHSIAS